ncbi:MAG: M20/M25/M40 family metallo-hydrolase [Pseudomonadota bacterium]
MDAPTTLTDFAALPFDADAMVAGLKPWIECESPTHDAAAVDRMIDLAACDLAAMGASIERIPGHMGLGGAVRATFPHTRAGEPGILIAGHMDTVHPVGTLDVLPFRREGGKCWGPGIQDMKSGNYLSLEAIRQLAAAGIETPLPITVLFTPDEEIGTPATRELIEATARRQKYVLVPEPARSNGGVTWGRYAIARFDLLATGVPIHAGVDPRLGRSAVAEMARRVLEIEAMTSDDCTFSVGCVQAHQAHVNCVPSGCSAQVLSMAKRQEDLDRGVERMLALSETGPDISFQVTRGVTRPVWEPSEEDRALHTHATGLARDLGFEIPPQMSGGGSDGNFTGAMGIPTLDSLGARGAGLHTLTEHIEIESLPERGKLMAGLLATLA